MELYTSLTLAYSKSSVLLSLVGDCTNWEVCQGVGKSHMIKVSRDRHEGIGVLCLELGCDCDSRGQNVNSANNNR